MVPLKKGKPAAIQEDRPSIDFGYISKYIQEPKLDIKKKTTAANKLPPSTFTILGFLDKTIPISKIAAKAM